MFKTQADLVRTLMETTKGSFAKSLGIDLCSSDSTEIFKWFLAAILYGARLPEEIARRTFQTFDRDGVICPRRILNTGWEGLVRLLDEGGYARYDFKTATKLLEMAGALENNYGGDLNRLHDLSRDRVDLEKRLQFLAKGIGQVTTNIFLREMRGIWEKADPIPGDLCIEAARELGFISRKWRSPEKILWELKLLWQAHRIPGLNFSDFEAALVRQGIQRRRKKK